MALSRRTGARFQASIWPGFVDAMTGLLLVLMFVLTIFMVLQFVLQETITGQENELSELSAEVSALASALGLEQDRSTELGSQVGALTVQLAGMQAELSASEIIVAAQGGVIAQLGRERDELTSVLSAASTQISGLQARETELVRAQVALNLALIQARAQIDDGEQAARLAQARSAALESLVAQMEADGVAAREQISDLEAERLVDAAAAEALRARLEGADTELSAMTLALEEQRRDAENTLTLLAAAQSARAQLDENLAIALLAQKEAEAAAQASGVAREELAAQLAATLDETQLVEQDLEARLVAALSARAQVQTELSDVTDQRAAMGEQLAAAVAALAAAQGNASASIDRQTALLAQANASLAQEEALSAQSRREVALLNQQVAALRAELAQLQGLLNLANDADSEANVQIETLTQNLNTALARALLAERRSNAFEAAELERLAAEAADFERYRSDFLGLLRGVLEGVEGVRIEGDRFVFSSEVLFEPAAAQLSAEGQREIAKVADILRDVGDDIPEEIDWVIRVDGHTDNLPLSGFGAFENNWELSQARALSVVLYMVDFLEISPERLAANGFGEYQPVDTADTDFARAQNRRIELKLTER